MIAVSLEASLLTSVYRQSLVVAWWLAEMTVCSLSTQTHCTFPQVAE